MEAPTPQVHQLARGHRRCRPAAEAGGGPSYACPQASAVARCGRFPRSQICLSLGYHGVAWPKCWADMACCAAGRGCQQVPGTTSRRMPTYGFAHSLALCTQSANLATSSAKTARAVQGKGDDTWRLTACITIATHVSPHVWCIADLEDLGRSGKIRMAFDRRGHEWHHHATGLQKNNLEQQPQGRKRWAEARV